MSELMDNPTQMTARLRAWAEQNKISPAEFARAMDYSYNHAYQLLRGNVEVTENTLGRLALAYGADAVAEIVPPDDDSEETDLP